MVKNNLAILTKAEEKDIVKETEKELKKVKKLKTDKKYLKRMEKIVRKLDSILADMADVRYEIEGLENGTEFAAATITNKDVDRAHEISQVLSATGDILYQLISRMSRKYVGKDIEEFEGRKRKSLKR